MIIENIYYLNAFKLVPYPGNADMGADLVEGRPEENKKEEQSMDLTTLKLEALNESRPDLVEAIKKPVLEESKKASKETEKKLKEAEAQSKKLSEEKAEAEKKLAEAEKKAKDLEAKVEKEIKESEKKDSSKAEENKALAELKKEMQSRHEEQAKIIESLSEKNKELTSRLDEKEVQERIMAKNLLIEKMVKESDLPEEAKTEVFMNDLKTLTEKKNGEEVITIEAQVKERIEDRKKICVGGPAVVKESGKADIASAKPQNAEEEEVVTREAFSRKYSKEWGMPEITPDNVLVEYRKRKEAEKK